MIKFDTIEPEVLRASSGGQNCIIQHLVSSHL